MNNQRAIRMMIVDDSKTMRNTIKSIASVRPNIELVAEASNGQDAIGYFRARKPNVVTMDITMPKLDGIAAIRKLMEIDSTVKIIVISALNDKGTAMMAIEEGAHAFLDKPFSEAELMAEIDRLGF